MQSNYLYFLYHFSCPLSIFLRIVIDTLLQTFHQHHRYTHTIIRYQGVYHLTSSGKLEANSQYGQKRLGIHRLFTSRNTENSILNHWLRPDCAAIAITVTCVCVVQLRLSGCILRRFSFEDLPWEIRLVHRFNSLRQEIARLTQINTGNVNNRVKIKYRACRNWTHSNRNFVTKAIGYDGMPKVNQDVLRMQRMRRFFVSFNESHPNV